MSIWQGLLRQEPFVDQCTRHLPPPLQRAAVARHTRTCQTHAGPIYDGTRHANIELREFAEALNGPLPWSSSGDALRPWAKARARQTGQAMSRNGHSSGAAYEIGARIAHRFGLNPPKPSPEHPLETCVKRLRCERWWRRQARHQIERRNETAARTLGLVQARTGRYVSDYTATLWRNRQQRNQAILRECEAVNEQGDTYSLAELVATSVANPELRRNELMARLAGTEAYARDEGDVAAFFTWTAPSYRHAVHSRTGRVDRHGASYSPRDTHTYLCRRWEQARAQLARLGVRYYGIRVAEPHHDGTPHWHLLVFVQPGRPLKQLERTLREYALKDAPNEPGARKHRFTVKHIDPAKGTAAGYVAKYIAKNIDGAGLDAALALGSEGDWLQDEQPPATAAERARAWASTWGIRQFQFFGVPEVGPWRELRRLDSIEGHNDAEQLRLAADAGDWQSYMQRMGGPCVPRAHRPARIERVPTGRHGLYGEPLRKPLIRIDGVPYDARPHEWQITHKPTEQPEHPLKGQSSLKEPNADLDGSSPNDSLKASCSLKGNPPEALSLKGQRPPLKGRRTEDAHVTLSPIDAPYIDGAPPIPNHLVGSPRADWQELQAPAKEERGPDGREPRAPAAPTSSS